MKTVTIDGDVWNVWAEGHNDGEKTYCHLASTTEFRQQKNGKVPVQRGQYVDNELLKE